MWPPSPPSRSARPLCGEPPPAAGVSVPWLDEQAIGSLLSPASAIEALEGALAATARGALSGGPDERLELADGRFAVAGCVDRERGLAGARSSIATSSGGAAVVVLFSAERGELRAVIEADTLEQLRAGAASALAARHLAREGAATLGVVGCGRLAAAQVACIRAGLPGIAEVVVSGRDARRLEAFCRAHRCTAAASNREAAEQDIVVTVTGSHDPVLRGEWLREGALVIAVGANDPADRELDNTAIERASFVCCSSREQSRREAGDLIDPVTQGVLEWLEVHELHELVAGELQGRASPEDLVLFKSNPLAAWDIALGARALDLAQP